jgi:hypothetical protein
VLDCLYRGLARVGLCFHVEIDMRVRSFELGDDTF